MLRVCTVLILDRGQDVVFLLAASHKLVSDAKALEDAANQGHGYTSRIWAFPPLEVEEILRLGQTRSLASGGGDSTAASGVSVKSNCYDLVFNCRDGQSGHEKCNFHCLLKVVFCSDYRVAVFYYY